ncbi:MAG: glycoside hydrolase family 2 TIM barrel-domain containing protein [Armatimonadota bacterium]|nr:glycoside hydrolase family 2 TIM barrel-domain containing protein [Armatimonadota bacterium]
MYDIPRPEHPRPDFMRAAWQNLNGKWQFAIDNEKSGMEKGWHTGHDFPSEILVPFCPESRLSGIGMTDFMNAVWYRRHFKVDKALQGRRLLLHFGAVDYEARVWVNGHEVAHHRGGYTPFSADVTDVVDMNGENELVVYAVDELRTGFQPSGKQSHRLESYGCMYTRTTGIWQTVWLEAVPETYISSLAIWPDAMNGRVALEIGITNPAKEISLEAKVLTGGKEIRSESLKQISGQNVLTISIPRPKLWWPGRPFLYDLRLCLLKDGKVTDEVMSYFGLRDVRIDGDRVLINGKPIFMRLILDQGFWPDGIYTAPSDAELKADIQRSMAYGFNGARLHQKVFEPRTLYWADKLGYILWGEFPDWGCSIANHPQARENFIREWTEVVLRDRNHPAIIVWMPLNEAHSSHDRYLPVFFRELYNLTKRLDPSRPFIDASGYTHVITDIWDLHDYDQNPKSFAERYGPFGKDPKTETLARNDPKFEPPYTGQPVVVSEYGGIWWNPGQKDDKAWGYGDRPKTEKEFIERYRGLANVLLENPHIAGFCYTQLTDVEQEVNGLYTYDRKPKFPPEKLKPIIAKKAAIER